MHRTTVIRFAAGAVGLLALPVSAAMNALDHDFMLRAASGNMVEMQSAQLAQQRGSSTQVRQFAARMITDHGQANDDLQQIAQQANVELPSKPMNKDAVAAQRLGGLNGAAFDQAYVQTELRGHQANVALFRKEAASGQDPALKEFAQKMLPTLQQHLQLAQTLNTNR